MRLIKDTNIDFMKQMRVGFILSGVIILLGLGSLLFHGGPKLSIDFEGGTMVAVHFTKEMDVNDIRNSCKYFCKTCNPGRGTWQYSSSNY